MIETLGGMLLWWILGAACSSLLLGFYESSARPRDYSIPLDERSQKDIRHAQNKLSAIVGIIVAFIYYIVRSNRYTAP